jgi:alpha-ketoglutarate-dependent taurine dioxygenase
MYRPTLPFIIEPARSSPSLEESLRRLSGERERFRNQLLLHGGLLFRGFPLRNADDFAAAVEALHLGEPVDYIGGDSPRDKVQGPVYTSTEAPPSLLIPLHNELSFVRDYPKHIYFFCVTPPQAAGETILGDARDIYRAIRPEVRQRFVEGGLRYVSAYYEHSRLMQLLNRWQRSHKSWSEVFEATSREEVERKCRAAGFQFAWTKKGWITVTQERPAVMRHPETQDEVWFNQAHLYDFNPKLLGFWRYVGAKVLYARAYRRLHEVFFASGGRIPRSDIYHILQTLDAHTIRFPWQKGDLLVLDNVLTMHGRAPFRGPRRILTALTA